MNITTPSGLNPLTSRTNTDYILVWDLDEINDQKLKRMDISVFLTDPILYESTQIISTNGVSTYDNPLNILTNNLSNGYTTHFKIGYDLNTYNSSSISFSKIGDGSQSNEIYVGIYGAGITTFRANGYGNIGIGTAPAGSGGYKLIVNGTASFPVSLTADEKIVIPLNQPTSLENGCIWIA